MLLFSQLPQPSHSEDVPARPVTDALLQGDAIMFEGPGSQALDAAEVTLQLFRHEEPLDRTCWYWLGHEEMKTTHVTRGIEVCMSVYV